MLERLELEAFLALAEELHFGRTAERLHVSTGRISQTIKKLERQVGAPLFERTSRRVTLTAIGRQLHEDLRQAHQQLEAGLARAVNAAVGIHGTLRAGYSAPWNGNLMIKAADAFHSRHPDCDVHIQEVQLHDPLGPLRAGALDLQLTEFPIDEPDITTGPVIAHEPRALIVSADHPLARRDSVCLEDLAHSPLVTITGTIPPYWLEEHYPLHTPAGRPITRGPGATYWQELLSLVATGKGISPICARAAHYYSRPDLAFIPFSDAPLIVYGLLWPSDRENARVRAFVKTLSEIAGMPPPRPALPAGGPG
ncbi:DNA-binding transcriptional LysR family regulator [Streptosporangium album]|uniref:DNA-binding transcriptional LysR family regulator n=1 Tax=Streptosporangium album TaxID=47479 RepID=A0A7W7WE89_9ACTN|nr:LysR family transcriptional regulator [Streptosporangium album]MBB4943124.1 DNA-binding transcriptional LysR family regulator [Streptosporangium album]